MRHLALAISFWVAPVLAQEDFSGLLELAVSKQKDGLNPAQVRPAFTAALSVFLKLNLDDPRRSNLLPLAGRAALGAGRVSLACDLLEEVRLEGVTNAFLVSWWCRAQLSAGAIDATLRRAREWDQEYPEAVGKFVAGADGAGREVLLIGAGRALRHGDTALGLWLFERAAAGQNPIALANLALAQRHLDRLEEAERSYRRALELAPEDGLLWNDFGLFWKGLGRLSEAWEAFQKSYHLEVDKGMGPATTNLLLLSHSGRRRWVESAIALEALLRLRPDAALARRMAIDRILAGMN